MFSPIQRTVSFNWVFVLAAFLILVFGMEVVWWQAALVLLLSQVEFKITYS